MWCISYVFLIYMIKYLIGNILREDGLAHSLREYSPRWGKCAVGDASQRKQWVLVHICGDQEAKLNCNP